MLAPRLIFASKGEFSSVVSKKRGQKESTQRHTTASAFVLRRVGTKRGKDQGGSILSTSTCRFFLFCRAACKGGRAPGVSPKREIQTGGCSDRPNTPPPTRCHDAPGPSSRAKGQSASRAGDTSSCVHGIEPLSLSLSLSTNLLLFRFLPRPPPRGGGFSPRRGVVDRFFFLSASTRAHPFRPRWGRRSQGRTPVAGSRERKQQHTEAPHDEGQTSGALVDGLHSKAYFRPPERPTLAVQSNEGHSPAGAARTGLAREGQGAPTRRGTDGTGRHAGNGGNGSSSCGVGGGRSRSRSRSRFGGLNVDLDCTGGDDRQGLVGGGWGTRWWWWWCR